DVEPIEEVAAVQRGRALERRPRAARAEALESIHVDVDSGDVERDRAVVLHQCLAGGAERLAQVEQRLAQAVRRLRVTALAPQQRRELLARVCAPDGPREIREQRLALRGANGERRPVAEPCLESAEQRE